MHMRFLTLSVLFLALLAVSLGDDDIESFTNQTLSFSDADGRRIAIPVGGCQKTGSVVTDYDSYTRPWHIEMPKPANNSRTYVVRHWMCNDIPADAKTIDVSFGRNGRSVDFSFAIDRK